MTLIASLPMYDWPERRHEVDAEWQRIRMRLVNAGVDAPERLTRDIGDDLFPFWQRQDILLTQTCWGPMEIGIANYVQVVGQQNYDGLEGGRGEDYSSAIVVFRQGARDDVAAPQDGRAILPLDLMRGKRFAYNQPDSMSGYRGLMRDLEALGESGSIFGHQIPTGGHRSSVRKIANGDVDVAAIDCLSWALAKKYEPEAVAKLQVVGWSARRKGLPFITPKSTMPDVVAALKAAVAKI